MRSPLHALPRALLLALFAGASLAACPSPDGEPEPEPTPDAEPDASPFDADVEPRCAEGFTPWSPGTSAFTDVTEAWGLSAIGAEGTRLAASDLDNDGYPDLFVRRGGTRSDDPAAGERHHWLLFFDGERFVDRTDPSGILAPRQDLAGRGRPAEVAAFADVDNDGDLDLYTGISTADPAVSLGETSELLLNQTVEGAPGTFVLGPAGSEIRRAGAVDAVAGASFLDYDKDGLVDLFVAEHNYDAAGGTVFQHDRLFANAGEASFVDETAPAGLVTADWNLISDLNQGRAHSRAWGSAACDLDGDGWQDLLVPSYGRSPNHLWRGGEFGELGQAVTGFQNRSVASGYAYDDDTTWQDNQFARCYCQANPGADGCEGVGAPLVTCNGSGWVHTQDREPFRLGGNSATTVCADLDNDEDIDLFTTEIKHWWAGAGSDGSEVLVNESVEGDIQFVRPGDEMLGLAIDHSQTVSWDEGHMTAAVFDFDHDGWQDIYLGASDYDGNRGRLYHHLGITSSSATDAAPVITTALGFEEVPVADGIDHWRSHGVAVADFDRDGDLDVVVGHSLARCGQSGECYESMQVRAFENLVGERGNWLQLVLEGGAGTNRAAIGARVKVEAGGITQTREVGGGHGHYGVQHDVTVHVGLGSSCEADVTVRWPDAAGTEETFHLPAGWRFRIVQGEGRAVAIP